MRNRRVSYKEWSLFFFVMFILFCMSMILVSYEKRIDKISRELDLVEQILGKN
jgi:hypothetical protein